MLDLSICSMEEALRMSKYPSLKVEDEIEAAEETMEDIMETEEFQLAQMSHL